MLFLVLIIINIIFIFVNILLFFVQTKKMALWLVTQMSEHGHAVALLSGELTVQQRISVLDSFREGKEKVLVTTNVLSRGNTMFT